MSGKPTQAASRKLNQRASKSSSTKKALVPGRPSAPKLVVSALSGPSSKPSGAASKNEQLKFIVFSQWPKSHEDLEDAPEIGILYKKSRSGPMDGNNCLFRLLRILGTLCGHRGASYGLANFKPIIARTNNTLDYVRDCVIRYTKSAAASSKVSVPAAAKQSTTKVSPASNVKGPNKGNTPAPKAAQPPTSNSSTIKKEPPKTNPIKHQFLKEFYEVAYQSLQYLRKGIHHYKEIILTLSFSRYSEYKLTGTETKLTKGKSIIGSCIWTLTCALKQLQEDPAVEQIETSFQASNKPENKNTKLLHDLSAEMLILINLSFDTWNEAILAINILERIHLKTEEVFRKQTSYFHHRAPPDSVQAISASVHLKKYRRSESDALELRKFKPPVINSTGRKTGYPRILYNTNYTKKESQWRGLDPLPVSDKVGYLKEVMKFVKLVLESVKETVQKIAIQLQGSGTQKNVNAPKPTSGVTSYENGITKLEDFIKKNISSNTEWSMEETEEFFETDKIFLDDIDLVTLGAAVTRTILHDARHCIHICYETSRLLNFKEFISLPEYDKVQKIYYKTKDDAAKKRQTSAEKSDAPRKTSVSYDIEESPLDLRNLHGLFRNNPYHEVAKVLPVYCTKVGLTLQDTDLVFTPSSEKLLSEITMNLKND